MSNKPYLCASCKQELHVSESEDGIAILVKNHRCGYTGTYEGNIDGIISYLEINQFATAKEIGNHINQERSNTSNMLHDLMERGLIDRNEDTRPYLYYLVDNPHRPNISIISMS